MQSERMTRAELRAGASLSAIFGLRMLGLFFILPVFVLHAPNYAGGDNLTLVGFALGAYGLTQAMPQIPFGAASDRWGRKPVIYLGLVIFAAGSLLAASAQDIWTAIAGRSLQGAGAISAVVMALAADLTREAHRTKVMAMIGSTIGLSFALSLVAAPALYRMIGMGGLFLLVATLSLAAIWVVAAIVPDVPPRAHAAPGAGGLAAAVRPELLRLNFGIFVLHLVQMAMFVVLPRMIVDAGLALEDHWKLYLPVVLASFALMVPAILHADRRNRPKRVLIGAVLLLIGVQAALAATAPDVVGLGVLMLAFFVAFNVVTRRNPFVPGERFSSELNGDSNMRHSSEDHLSATGSFRLDGRGLTLPVLKYSSVSAFLAARSGLRSAAASDAARSAYSSSARAAPRILGMP